MSLVAEIFGIRNDRYTNGQVGIEIEVEGSELPTKLKYWACTRDGSLNEDGMEYVLHKPLSVKDSFIALDELSDRYKAMSSTVHETIRAGIHIHVNMQNSTVIELHNYITAYLIFEELLVNFCGEDREGNLFCLRASDAKALPHMIRSSLITKDFRRYSDENYRYASINLASLHKYGSLEFRSMRSTTDFQAVKTWINLLMSLKQFSAKFKRPDQIIESLSEGEFSDFVVSCFGDNTKVFDKTNEELSNYVRRGVRNAQIVAFATDWGVLSQYFQDDNSVKKDTPSPRDFINALEPAVAQAAVVAGRNLALEMGRAAAVRAGLRNQPRPMPAAPIMNWMNDEDEIV